MQKALLTLSIVGLIGGGVATARTLTPAEALSRALSSSTSRAQTANVNETPVMTIGETSAPALYIFDRKNDNGYIVIAADDVAAPLLGYSDSGTFDPDNMPDNMRWWLSQYQSEIEAATANGTQSYSRAGEEIREAIAPLIKTTWNQTAPYNNLAPIFPDLTPTYPVTGDICATGCVATAMAQVMKFHEWPKSFKKNFSYKWTNASIYHFAPANLTWNADVEFAWSDMLDSYQGTFNGSQATAVATLMKACGYSVDMNYGIDVTGGSGANSANIPKALTQTFDYDKGLYEAFRQFYGLNEWETLIYNELKANRPIIYSGANAFAGHCFVCDGYQDGFYHFNWGWGGMSDSYFRLTALTPGAQGTGGSADGYDIDQSVIIGVQPPIENSDYAKNVVCMGNFNLSYDGKTDRLYMHGRFFNVSQITLYGEFGLRFVDSDGKIIKETLNEIGSDGISPNSGYSQLGITGTIPTGTFKVYPIFKPNNGETFVIPCPADQAGYVILTKDRLSVNITVPEIGEYKITDVEFQTPLYMGQPFMVTATTSWTGNISVSTPITGVFLTNKSTELSLLNIAGVGPAIAHEFNADGETSVFEYLSENIYRFTSETSTTNLSNADAINLSAGKTYYFAMAIEDTNADCGLRLISEPIEIVYEANPGAAVTEVEAFIIENQHNVDPNNLDITVRLQCKSGFFFGHMVIAVFDIKNDYQNVSQFNTNTVPIQQGHTESLIAKGGIPNAKPGDKYLVGLYSSSGTSPITSQEITIGDYTAISDISADAARGVKASPNPAVDYTVITAGSEISRVDIASLSGSFVGVPVEIDGTSARVDVSALANGLYIARVVTATGVESVKIIKK
ncbi:MAG: thiol protease/hemagglutinin PrtT [Bacteroides sp.]|nr:thiol protease/hemagglutinin PrtT [Bacteroides sp.]